jgi:hypothetical protein
MLYRENGLKKKSIKLLQLFCDTPRYGALSHVHTRDKRLPEGRDRSARAHGRRETVRKE